MNLVPSNQNSTMTSREIAELTGKRHDHVLRDIRNMLTTLYGDEAVNAGIPEEDKIEKFFEFLGMGIDSPKLGNQRIQGLAVSRDGRGFVSEISLDYSHTMTLISGYNVKLRKNVIDRWQYLEAQQTIDPMKLLNDPAAMRGLLLGYTEKVLSLELTVATQAPKVEAFDRIAEADGCLGLQEAGKALQQKPNKFIGWLREKGWIYRRAGSKNNLGHAEKVNSGYVTHKVKTIDLPDGSQKVCEQAMITPKGLAKLAMMLNVNQSRSIDLFGGAA